MQPILATGKVVNNAPGLRTYIGQLDGDANLASFTLMPRGEDRKRGVVNELLRNNDSAMERARPGLDALKSQGLLKNYEVNPLSNTIVLDVDDTRAAEAWKAINAVDGMGRIVRNREVHALNAPLADAADAAAMVQPEAIEWNVAKIGADKVWAKGFNGQGVTVGIVDTGADLKHPAIKAHYRGTKADGTFDNNYNWFDAFGKSTTPYDDQSHGTHVTGTAVGGTADRGIGVAPGAKFISSKILDGNGSGTLLSVTKGLEWMLAPTDSTGKNPDATKAPDVVSNSWGTNDGRLKAFQNIWKAFNAAGIVPVAAAGNSGPRAGSVGAPGSYPEGISVGATDKDDKVASFSSRGPSPIPASGGNTTKPDVSAPGKDVVSAIPGGGYKAYSGTSMATPAISGVVALLLSKHRDLSNDEVRLALTNGSIDIAKPGVDNDSGAGRIDAMKALAAADAIVAARKK